MLCCIFLALKLAPPPVLAILLSLAFKKKKKIYKVIAENEGGWWGGGGSPYREKRDGKQRECIKGAVYSILKVPFVIIKIFLNLYSLFLRTP